MVFRSLGRGGVILPDLLGVLLLGPEEVKRSPVGPNGKRVLPQTSVDSLHDVAPMVGILTDVGPTLGDFRHRGHRGKFGHDGVTFL